MSDDAQGSVFGSATASQAYYRFLDRRHPDDYRHQEIQKLVQAIHARENRLVLGLPGMGVSNLLRFLVARDHLFNRNVISAYMNCDTLADCHNLETFFQVIAGELHNQGIGNQPVGADRGYEQLRQLVTRIDGGLSDRVVIVVDQADELLSMADTIFYRRLKALTDLNKRVCWIFAASPRSADIIDPDNLLFAGRRLAVGRLNERDLANVIAEEARRLEVEFDAATQALLARLSGGHPGLLRALSSAAVQGALDAPEAILAERLLARGDVKARCRKLWDGLDLARHAALQSLVNAQPESVPAETLDWLQDFGLVEEHEGLQRLFSPIFEQFIARRTVSEMPLELVPATSVLTLDPVTIVNPTFNDQGVIEAGQVMRGSANVDVGPLELRLIACLKRERKIYTKHVIAEYVYYEDEGVVPNTTIESLVSQVRRRLGKHYIKTHYGQGYEFMA